MPTIVFAALVIISWFVFTALATTGVSGSVVVGLALASLAAVAVTLLIYKG